MLSVGITSVDKLLQFSLTHLLIK